MPAEKSPHGVGRQMNNRLASRLLHRRSLRAQRQSCQQRATVADRSAQVGSSERSDGVIADDQKRVGLGARERSGEHRRTLLAGD